jgi:hypothetical protein
MSHQQYSGFKSFVSGFVKYHYPSKWFWRFHVSSQWCGGVGGKYDDKTLATLTPKSTCSIDLSLILAIQLEKRESSTCLEKRGSICDPSIPMTNERVPHGKLE